MKSNYLRWLMAICLLVFTLPLIAQNGVVRVKDHGYGAENSFLRVIRTVDNHYVVLMKCTYPTQDRLIKYDPAFNTIWERPIGNSLADIIQTADGGFIATGTGSSDGPDYSENVWVQKFNGAGQTQWLRNYGGTQNDNGVAIRQKANGNYVIYASANSSDGDVLNKTQLYSDAWIFELNAAGAIVDQTILGGSQYDANGGSIAVTADGGLIMAVSTASTDGDITGNHGGLDAWVVKLDNNYNIQWRRAIGGSADDYVHSIYQDQAGDYIIAGGTRSADGDLPGTGTSTDGYVLKLDPAGNTKWMLPVAGVPIPHTGASDEDLYAAKPIAGNDIIVVGSSASNAVSGFAQSEGATGYDALLFRVSAQGTITWSRKLGGNGMEWGQDVTESVNGGFILIGKRMFQGFGGDITGVAGQSGELMGLIMEVRNLSTIKGVVYLDNNNNKIMEPGEPYDAAPVNTAKVSYNANVYPIGGNFIQSVDTGTYVTRLKHTGIFDTTAFAISPKRKVSVLTNAVPTDSFPIRIVPIGLVEDLEVSISQLSMSWLDHAVTYRLRIRNHGGKTISNAQLKLKLDHTVRYHSSAIAPNTIAGDTLIWNYPAFPGLYKDSIDVTLFTNTVPDVLPLQYTRLQAIAGPYSTDFDTLDNIALNQAVIFGQNIAISNITVTATAPDTARINRTIPYRIRYSFNSMLDSTKGTIRLVKDPNMSFVSATPAPASINNDTLTWNFKDLSFGNADTILINLKTIDSGGLNIGEQIHLSGQLRFHTADTAELVRGFHLSKLVTGYYVEPDNTNTPLLPPHGIRWTRSFGGTNDEYAHDVVALPDSGFIVVGQTLSKNLDMAGSHDTSSNGFIGRFDKDGHLLWKQILGGPRTDGFLSVEKASADIFYASGGVDTDSNQAWIVKFNSAGDILWNKTYGGSGYDVARSVLSTSDGGCIFVGQTNSSNGDVHDYELPATGATYPYIMWLVKLDANGVQQWDSCYTGPTGTYFGFDLKRTKDDKILVGGYNYRIVSPNTFVGGLLLLLNNDGSRVMEKVYETPGLRQAINSVVVNDDNSFTFIGYSGTEGLLPDTSFSGIHGGQNDVWIVKVDNAGNEVWEKYFGGTQGDIGEKIILTSDGNYVAAAYSYSNNGNVTGNHNNMADAWLVKVDTAGKLVWQKTFGGTKQEILNSVAELGDRSLLAAGYTNSIDGDITGYRGGVTDILLAKIGVSNFIAGAVYIDLNNNGTKEPDEPYFKKGQIKASSSTKNHSGFVIDGLYRVSVDTGNYTVKFSTVDSAYYDIIPPSGNVTFNEYSQTAEVNFRLVKKADVNDLRLNIIPLSIARPGFTAGFGIRYENKGTIEGANVTIRIKMGDQLTYLSSTVPYSSLIGDTLVWNLPAPDVLETGSFDLTLRIKAPPEVNNGDTLLLYGDILPIEIDVTPENNIVLIKQIVQGSYDPNDKIEVHGNIIPLDIVVNEEFLTYVIRFQNTGTDTAFNVYVRDTLSNKFDWNTFEMIDASHPYELTVQDGNKIEWYFRDIFLADSNVNEPASHGFIAFRIKPRNDLQLGDSVSNDAGIYFDFNLPVQTNLMLGTIGLNAALPSTILQFTAAWKDQATAQLKWVVVNESKVHHYEVEHSVDGVQYRVLGTVQAINDNNPHQYGLIHQDVFNGVNYYRLKTVDVDGSVVYSRPVLLKKDMDIVSSLKLYPVPAKESVTVFITGKLKGQGTISIYSVDGKLVQLKSLGSIDQQDMRVTVDCNTLNKGVYILQCTIGDRNYRGRLVVQ